jgi:hypothetical protein
VVAELQKKFGTFNEGGIQPGQSRLLTLVVRSTRPTLAEVLLADLCFK